MNNVFAIIASGASILLVGVGLVAQAGIENRMAQSVASVVCTAHPNDIQVIADAAYVFDIQDGTVIFEKNAQQQMPLASLAKLMTVLVAMDTLKPNATITIPEAALAPEGDAGLLVGEKWDTQDLIDFTLITSANDGAHALALATLSAFAPPTNDFPRLMNQKAHDIGLVQSYFLNDTGLDVSTTTSGAYGSARDVAHLLSYIYTHASSVFDGSARPEESFTSASGFVHSAHHTSGTAGTLPGESIAKTGFTDLAGGNLAIVAEPVLGKPIAIVVLHSSREARDHDVSELYTYAKSALKRTLLCEHAL